MLCLVTAVPASDNRRAATRKWQIAGLVALIIAALIIWSAWPKPLAVDVVAVQKTALRGQLSATGEVDGPVARVGAKAGGEVEQVYVEEGQPVSEGAPLARVSPPPTGLPETGASMLDLQVVASPFAGVVARRYVDPGDAAVPGQPLFAVVAPDQLWIVAYVDDVDLPKLSVGMAVGVSRPAYLSRSYRGQVVSVSPLAEPRSELGSGARTVRARIQLTEPMPGLVPGIEVNVDATVTLRSEALLVPVDAISEDDSQRYVWMVRAGRAEKQPIETGVNNYLAVEILKGLAEGDIVVVSGKDLLKAGQVVRPSEVSIALNVE